jgi:chromosome segregation ATPase
MSAELDSLATVPQLLKFPERIHFSSMVKPAKPEDHIVTQLESPQTRLSSDEAQYRFLKSGYRHTVIELDNLAKEHSKYSSLQAQLESQKDLVSQLEDRLAEQQEMNVKLQENTGLLTSASEGYRARILEKAKEVDLLEQRLAKSEESVAQSRERSSQITFSLKNYLQTLDRFDAEEAKKRDMMNESEVGMKKEAEGKQSEATGPRLSKIVQFEEPTSPPAQPPKSLGGPDGPILRTQWALRR